MARKLRQKIGEILIANKVATDDKVKEAIDMAKSTGKRVGEVLIEMGVCSEEDVARVLAEQFGMEFLNLDRAEDSARIDMSLIKEEIIKKHVVLPLSKTGGRLKVLIHDPMDLEMLDMLRFRLGAEIDTAIASRRQISYYIEGDRKGAAVAQAQAGLLSDSMDVSVDKSVDKSMDKSIDIDASEEAPMVKLVNRIILEGVLGRASDIHVEPMKDYVLVRYRIDGVCVVRDKLPKRNQPAILARFKLMAGVNMAEKRIPQDGRIKMPVQRRDANGQPIFDSEGKPENDNIDFRASTCPAYHGESVVLRILRPDSVRIGLANLGLEQDTLDVFNKVIRRPNGIFLVTGPTGSGKTTTLYSALDTLNRPDRKIITAEDPVEYNFPGINQVQVREHIGLTFPSILKSMLRQAPNIILVGEIRDREVADIAIQAALTGHLVFSTLHTNDAPSAITRLIDMGVKPFLVASSIQAVLAQRLVRILCDKCKGPDPDVDPKLLKLVGISELERDQVMGPKGCPACGGVGYKGRRGIYEMMIMNAEIRQLAFERSGISKLRSAAVRNGMRGLLGDGRLKILKGRTTPEEIAKFAQIEGFDPATEMAV
ncbi:MAG: Type traffic warden ATPase [Planctomycetota bacterium]